MMLLTLSRCALIACALLAWTMLAWNMPLAAETLPPLLTEKDASIFSNNPTNTAGGQDVVYVGKNTGGNTRRALVQFDIAGSGIPVGSTIDSVSLVLYLNGFTGSVFGADRTISVHRVLQSWGNGTTGSGGSGGGGGQGTASAANGDVSWNLRSFSTTDPAPPHLAWTTAGGDYLAGESASLTISNSPNPVVLNSPYTWSGPGLVSDVQQWLDGTLPNDGWLLRELEVSNGRLLQFYSREIIDNVTTTTIDESTLRPRLLIEFTPPATPVPEPGSCVLFAVGGVAVSLRFLRKRCIICALKS